MKVDSIANDITSHINKVNSPKIKEWIIDLRLNTGGNISPILLGLKEFISSDNIIFGGFRNSKGESSGQWEIKDGKMLVDGIELERQSQLNSPIKKDIPVVILTSCYTASANEMTAVYLIGRKNTYVVGEPTAGYTTAVQGFSIEVLAGDNLEDLKKDLKIKKALEMLKK